MNLSDTITKKDWEYFYKRKKTMMIIVICLKTKNPYCKIKIYNLIILYLTHYFITISDTIYRITKNF